MELLLKVGLGLLIAAFIIIGIMLICLAIGGIWSYIQDCLYDEWNIKLPPEKDYWNCEWKNTGELTKDVVPIAIMQCSHCTYKTPVMSRCCPACGKYMKNWDLEWDCREED